MVLSWILCKDRLPEDIPEKESFGVDYEVKYIDTNGQINQMETEWLWTREWNCIYPVVAWRPIKKIIPFSKKKKEET